MPGPVSPDENLEPIETASIGELRALQLRRLRWSVRHAYDNVGHYRKSFESAGDPQPGGCGGGRAADAKGDRAPGCRA